MPDREPDRARCAGLTPGGADRPASRARDGGRGPGGGPGWNAAGHADQMADQSSGSPGPVTAVGPDGDINAAAVAAYRASLQTGRPLSERKLAGSSARPPGAGHETGWPKPGQSLVPCLRRRRHIRNADPPVGQGRRRGFRFNAGLDRVTRAGSCDTQASGERCRYYRLAWKDMLR